MKKIAFLLLLVIPMFAFSQGKKDIKANKIKSRTISATEQKDGVPITYNESYEEYDKNGNTVTKIDYTKSGEIKNKQTFKYDSFGNTTEKVDFDKKSGKTLKTTYKYDAKGEKTEELVTDSQGNTVEKIVYIYDAKNLRTQSKEYNSKGEIKEIKKSTYIYF
jgi:hypothetical protein